MTGLAYVCRDCFPFTLKDAAPKTALLRAIRRRNNVLMAFISHSLLGQIMFPELGLSLSQQ